MTKKQRSAFLLEALESRLLFSSDAALLPIDGGVLGAEVDSVLEVSLGPAGEGQQESSSRVQSRLEVVFVDAGIDDYQELIDNLNSSFADAKHFEAVVLDSDQDGIEQISDYLNQKQNISAIHILSHGSNGEVGLGNSLLNANSLDQYAEAIEGWQQALTGEADLLFYGCNLAQGQAGLELIDNLKVLTGADIAASADATGHVELGGDWDLEYSAGHIETDVALSAATQESWNSLLAEGWTEDTSGTTESLQGVHFPIDTTTGYAVGASGTILKTTDGGSNWVSQTSGVTEWLYDVYFPTDNLTGYVAGSNGTILKTTDGGANWLPQTSGTTQYLFSISFPTDATTGYIVGGNDVILKTTDGGSNWSPLTTGTSGTFFYGVSFPVDATTGYAVGSDGTIIKTIDGGSNWTSQTTGTNEHLNAVHFPVDANTGYAVGFTGTVLKTSDGGSNWTPLLPNSTMQFNGVSFVDNLTGYVVGGPGVVLKTTDGGTSWTQQPINSSEYFRDIQFSPDAMNGFVVGGGGDIFNATDGGDGLTLHPTGDGSSSGFTVNGGVNGWEVVNDQTANAGTGTPATNDTADYLTDGSGARHMFSLDDGVVPAVSTITSIRIDAQVNKPSGGAKPTVQLSYQRMGTDGSPVDSAASAQIQNAIYVSVSETWTGLNWTASDLDNLEVGIVHASGGTVGVSQLYVSLTYETPAPATHVYYSVGQNTNDHKTGTPDVTISNGVATFSEAQTATNMGVGDIVTYSGWGSNNVRSVDALSSNEVWAVGYGGNVWEYDGSSWIQHDGTGNWETSTFFGVSAAASDSVWMAGSFGNVYEYDGSSWTQHDGTGKWGFNVIQNIYALPSGEVWIVGNSGTVWEYNGGSWSQHDGTGKWGTDTIMGVSASASNNIWITGSNGNVWEYNGSSWTQHDGTGKWGVNALYGVSALSSSEVWIAGQNGSVWEYNGGTWTQHDGTGKWDTNFLYDISAASSTKVCLTGLWGEVWEYDGSTWTQHDGTGKWGTNNVYSVSALAGETWIGAQNGHDWKFDGSTWNQQDWIYDAYISAKISETEWTLVTAKGETPTNITNATVNTIAHAFDSLSAAEAGAADSNHLNTTDLVAGNYTLNLACYYDTGADTTAVDVDDWTTGAGNYIKIYTPDDTATEVNQSQRHAGAWNTTSAYRMEVSNNTGIHVNVSSGNRHVKIEGLQIYVTSTNAQDQASIYFWTNGGGSGSVDFSASDNILRGTTSAWNYHSGINTDPAAGFTGTTKIYNNIIYGFKGTSAFGAWLGDGSNYYVYNNTISDSNVGLNAYTSSSIVATNNLIDASVTQAAIGTFLAGTDYNATNDASIGYTVTGGGNTHDRTSQTFTFAGAGNYHLAVTDTGALNHGADLSTDPNLAFLADIDGNARPYNGVWDIGADEALVNVVSGTVYSDEGSTNVGEGLTVRLLVNGVNAGTALTNASGQYSINATINAGDAVLVYVDENDGNANDGTTVSVFGGTSLSGLDIYVDHLTTRHDNAGALSNALMDIALGGYSDTEILYSVAGGDLIVSGSNTELYIPTSHSFTPGGNVTGLHYEILGTLKGDANTITATGTWEATSGTVTADTMTLVFSGSVSDMEFSPGSSSYYNVDINKGSVFFYLLEDLTLTNSLTFDAAGTGTFAVGSNTINTKDFTWGSGYLWGSNHTINVSGNLTTTGIGYFSGSLNTTYAFVGSGNGVFNPGSLTHGNITVNKDNAVDVVSLSSNPLNLAAGSALTIQSCYFDLAGNNLDIGAGSTFSSTGTLRLQGGETISNLTNDPDSGAVVYNGGGSYTGLAAGDTYYYLSFSNGAGTWTLDAPLDVNANLTISSGTLDVDNTGNHTINLAGNWTNSGTFLAQNGTVILDGNNQAIYGSTNFNNLTKVESSNDATDVTLTFGNTGTQTVNGTLTLDGLDDDDRINLVSDSPTNQWSLVLGASASQAIDYIEVTDSDASGSDGSQLPINPANSLNGGNNLGWFTVANSAPTINGTVAGQAVNDNATISPFAGVTIGDVDNPAQTLSVSVTLDTAAKGTFSTLNGFTDAGSGVYTYSGTAASATTAIRGLVFDSAENRVAPGSTETTTFTISVDDSIAAPTTNNTTTVVSTSVNDAPKIGGVVAGQAVNDNSTVSPFSGLTIGDADNPSQTLSVSVTLDTAAKGTFSTLSGFTDAGGGVYTFSGTAAAAQTAIRGLVFDPTENRVAPGSTETTTFTISVDDSVAAPTTNNTTTVVSTSVNDAPVLNGPGLFLTALTEDPVVNNGDLVSAILASTGGNPITDVDASAVEGIAIFNLSNSNGTWEYDIGSGWTAVGSVSVNSSLLLRDTDSLRFVPSANWNGTELFSFAAWDRTSGTAGTKVNTSVFGGTTAFSVGTAVPSITVNGVNDDPTVTNLDGDALNYTEGDGAVLLDQGGNALVADVDSSNFLGGSLNVEIDFNLQSAEDVLSIRNQGTGAGQIGVSGSDVTYSNIVIGTVTGGTGITPLTVTFNANATPAATTALVQNITYENTNLANPSELQRSVVIDIVDGDGGATGVNLVINVTASNDAPIVDLNGSDGGGNNFAVTFTEDGGAVNVTDADAVIIDVDDTTYQNLSINLRNISDGANERIVIAGYTFTCGTGETVVRTVGSTDFELDFDGSGFNVMLDGGGMMPLADLQTLMRGITYENITQNPTAGDRDIDFIAQDASGLNGPVATSTITVNPVNDAPTITNGFMVGLAGTDEDSASAGTTVSAIVNNAGWNDVDTGAVRGMAITGMTGNGTWQYSTDAVTWNSFGAVSSTNALLLSATTEIRYVGDGINGEVPIFDFRAWDTTTGTASTNATPSYANPGVGGGVSAFSSQSASANTTVTSVNDAPTASTGGAYAIIEGGSITLDASGSSDPENDTLTYRWDLDNDSFYDDLITGSDTSILNWATLQGFGITDEGSHTIGLEVDDGNGDTDTSSTTIDATNVAPTLVITPPGTITEGVSETFSLSATDPGADTIVEWIINWGDGNIDTIAGNPASVTHTYEVGGHTYDILASARDEDGTFHQNQLLVISSSNDKIIRLEPTTGTLINSFGNGGGINEPLDIILGPDGLLYVSGYMSHDVQRFNPTTGAYVDTIISGVPAFQGPSGLTFGPDGDLFISAYDVNKIFRYDIGSTTLTEFVSTLPVGASGPEGLVFGRDGDLFVVDYNNGQILEFDGDTGESLGVFASGGGLSSPEQIVVGPGGNLFVANYGSNQVLEYDGSTGAFLGAFASHASLNGPVGLTFGPDGHLYVTGWDSNNVVRFDGTTGAYKDVYVTAGTGGLSGAYYLTFLPQARASVATVNDAPTISSIANQTVDEDTATGNLAFTIDDEETAASSLIVTATSSNQTIIPDANITLGGSGLNRTINVLPALNETGGPVTITVTVDDGTTTTQEVFTITVNAVNDAPVNTVPGTKTLYEEAPTVIAGISINDADAAASSLTSRLQVSNGVLNVTLSGSATISAGANGAGDLTIQGTVADINATLTTLSYTGDTDVTGVAADTLTITTNDGGNTGSGGALQDVDTVQIDIAAMNDTPVVSGPGSALNATEQIDLAIHGTGFSVVDVDAGGSAVLVSLDVGEGTIAVAEGDSGVTISSGNGTGTVTFTGTISQANNLLSGVGTGTIYYNSGSDTPSASTSFTVTVNDQGNTGQDPFLTANSTSEEDSNSVTINIASVDDAAIIGGDISYNGNEGDAVGGDMDATDVEGLTDGTYFTVTAQSTNGTAAINADTGVWTYTPTAPNWFGSDSFTVTITDDLGGTTTQVVNITLANVVETITVGDGTSPADRNVWAGGYRFTPSTFTLSTDTGTDILTDLTVTFTGTDVNDVSAGGVKIWRDDGLTAGQWDESDTLLGSAASFSGTTASFNSLSETISTSTTQYLITYDIDRAATAGNSLQASVTAVATSGVGNPLTNNDNVDATLTVDADYVHDTSVYKFVYAPGIGEELYLKNTNSPDTNILQGMSLGSVYATVPGSLLMTWDPDTTVTTVIDNNTVKQVQMSGRLMHTSGSSYGDAITNITFYEDRMVFDLSITMDTALANEWMFMTYGTWDDAYLAESFEWSAGNSGTFTTADPNTNFSTGNQTSPISFQGLFEMGASDGLVTGSMQNISNYGTSQLKNTDADTGSVDIAYQRQNPVLFTTYQAAVQYTFDSTNSGYNTALAEERQDDFDTPATLNFGISGGDGALTGDGYSELCGAYTLEDSDADDHVRFEFQTTTTHHAPVFEIYNWDGAAPLVITVDGTVKQIGTDYKAAVEGSTLYLQYLGNVSANAIFEIGDDSISGTVYSDEGTTPLAGATVNMLVNGTSVGTTISDSNGRYAFYEILSNNDNVLVYLDDNVVGTDDGTSVTVIDGDSLAGLDIYVDHLIVRHDNAGAMTNVLLDAADGAGGDAEILYTLTGSDLTVESGTELYVAAGHSYTPGGNITTQGTAGNVEVLGTLTAEANTLTVSGDWDSGSGTFNYDTSTLKMTGVGKTLTQAGGWAATLYNLTIGNGASITHAGGVSEIVNDITLEDNSSLLFTIHTFQSQGTGNGDLVIGNNAILDIQNKFYHFTNDASSHISTTGTITGGVNGVFYYAAVTGNTAAPVTARTYDLDVAITGAADAVSVLGGGASMELGSHDLLLWDSGQLAYSYGTLDNSNNIDINSTGMLEIAAVWDNGIYDGKLIARSATYSFADVIVRNDGTLDAATGGGASVWNISNDFSMSAGSTTSLGGATLNIAGDWSRNGGTFNAGTSTVKLTGGDQAMNGSTSFYSLSKVDSVDDDTDLNLTIAAGSTQTINGTLTLDGLDDLDRINLISSTPGTQWDLIINAGATQAIDYVDVTDSDATGSHSSQKLLNPDNSINGSNTVDWFPSISGNVYSDEGTTAVADGLVVRLLVNGVDAGIGTTSGGTGAYSIISGVTAQAGDSILVYIDEDDGASLDGTTVTVVDGSSLSGLDIYLDHLITRHDNGGSLTNAEMDTAKGAYSDSEILYTLDASDNLTVETGTEIYVASGYTYNPGADVTSQGSAGNMEILGTLNGGASTFTISGDWDCVSGTFTGDSSTVVMTGTANTLRSNGVLGTVINDLTIAPGATITAQNSFWFDSDFTISGTFNVAAGEQVTMINPDSITINPGGELGGAGTFKQRVGSSPSVHTFNGTISVATYIYEVLNNAGSSPGHILTGANYGGDLLITLSGNTAENWVYISGGDLTVGGTLTVGSDRTWFGPFTAVLNNAQENRNVTVGNLVIGNATYTDQYGRFIAGSGTIDVNGDVTILASDAGGTNEIDAGSSTWNVSGNWTNNDSFTAGTSTVVLDGGNQAINGSTTFNNLSKTESSSDNTDSVLTIDNNGILTIGGTLTIDGLDSDDRINLVSDSPGDQWDIVLNASATANIDYIEVTDSDASGSDDSHLPIEPTDSLNGGNTIGWFNIAPTIGGTVAGQTVNDTATISPFSGVTIGDADSPAQTLSVTVTLDSAAKGVFSTLNGFTDEGGGVYSYDGTAANATTAIRGLVFNPTDGISATTTFTISVDDGIATVVTDNTTTVIASDITAPTVTVNVLSTNDTTPALSGTVNDAAASIQVTVNGNNYAATNNGDGTWVLADDTIAPALTEGVYEVAVTATDTSSNVGSDATSNELTIDTTAPTVTVNVLSTNDTTPALSGTVNDNAASIQVTVNGNNYAATNNGDGTWTLADDTIAPALTEGVYEVAVTATDAVGNVGSDATSNELTVDTTAPTVTVNVLSTNDTTPALSGTVNDTAASIQVIINGNNYAATNNGDGTWTLADDTIAPVLTEGVYEVAVTATDAVGNVGSDATSNELTVDTTTPTVTVNIFSTNDTTPALSGTVNDTAASIQVTVNGNNYAATNNGDGTWTLADDTIAPALTEGVYEVAVTATDAVGNVGSDGTSNELTIDTTAPMVMVNVLSTNDTTPALSGTVNDASAIIQVTVNGNNYAATNNGDGTWTLADDSIAPALTAGIYDVLVTATDAVGNLGSDASFNELTVITNSLPVAVADSFTVNEGTTTNLNLASNDTDADDGLDMASISIVTGPSHGSILIKNDGTVDYSHDGSETLTDMFTYTIDDLSTANSNTVTVTLTITPQNDAPTIGGTVPAQTVNDNATTTPFAGATIGDVDSPAQTLTVMVMLDDANKGSFSVLNGFTDAGGGVYFINGTATAATTALQGMVFDPAENRVAPGLTETTTFTVSVDDGVAAPVTDSTTTVISTSINDNPTLVTSSGSTIDEHTDTSAGVSVATLFTADPDPADSFTYSIVGGADAAKFSIGGAGGDELFITDGILHFLTKPSYQVLVRTTDSGGLVHDQLLNISVNDINLAPSATNLNTAEKYSVNTTLDLTDIAVADADNATVAVTLTLSDPGAGVLTTSTAGTTTSVYDAATGVWSASGAIADVNALLAQADLIPAVNHSSAFSIAVQVSDGIAAPLSGIKTVTGKVDYVAPPEIGLEDPPTDEIETDPLEEEESATEENSTEETGSSLNPEPAPDEQLDEGNDSLEESLSESLTARTEAASASKSNAQQPAQMNLSRQTAGLTEASGPLLSFSQIEFSAAEEIEPRTIDESKLPDFLATKSMKIAKLELQRFDQQQIDQYLLKSIKSTQEAIEDIEEELSLTTKIAVGSSFVFSIGVTSWLFRASSLVSAMVSSMPLWKRLDPLPVLSLSGKERLKQQQMLKNVEEEERQSDDKASQMFNRDSSPEGGSDEDADA